jgi:hypothetical protein
MTYGQHRIGAGVRAAANTSGRCLLLATKRAVFRPTERYAAQLAATGRHRSANLRSRFEFFSGRGRRAYSRVGFDACDYITSELISMIGTWPGVSQSRALRQAMWCHFGRRAYSRVGFDACDYFTSELISMIGTWPGVSQSMALRQAEAGARTRASALMPATTSRAN